MTGPTGFGPGGCHPDSPAGATGPVGPSGIPAGDELTAAVWRQRARVNALTDRLGLERGELARLERLADAPGMLPPAIGPVLEDDGA